VTEESATVVLPAVERGIDRQAEMDTSPYRPDRTDPL